MVVALREGVGEDHRPSQGGGGVGQQLGTGRGLGLSDHARCHGNPCGLCVMHRRHGDRAGPLHGNLVVHLLEQSCVRFYFHTHSCVELYFQSLFLSDTG